MWWRSPIAVGARHDLAAIAVLLAVSLAARLQHLARPFHGDEMISFSNMVLGRDFAGILFGPFDSNSHLLNSLIMKAVYLGAGENPALMRLPNLIFALIAIVLLYLVGSKVFGRLPAFAAALLFSLHPAMVMFSVWGRGYAGMILFTLISSVLFLRLPRSFSWGRWMGCAATGFLAGAAHLFAANVLIAQVVLGLGIAVNPVKNIGETFAARARRMGPVILAPLSALTLLVALVLPQLRQTRTESFHYPFQIDFPIALINFMGGTTYRTDLDGFSILLLALAVAGFIGLRVDPIPKTYLGLLFLAPISLYGLSYFAPVFTLHPRFFAFLLPFYCLLVVAGVEFAAATVGAKMSEKRRGRIAVHTAVWLSVGLVAIVFMNRIHVPEGSVFVRLQATVGHFVETHPDADFLTNDPGFVRVRLRQEAHMDRIHPALGIKPVRAFQAEAPTSEIYFIYVPKKRLTEADLIHYQGKVAPEVLYRRDDSLRMYLTRNATLELDAGPRVQIYSFGSRPAEGIETGSRN
jgi:hypothetical protein